MLSYCLKCGKNTENKNSKVVRTKNGKIILLSKCAVRDDKKWNFVKEREAAGLTNNLAIKAPLDKIPLLDPLLF